jgi:diguanylate cyclase (GGDEF)-like protein
VIGWLDRLDPWFRERSASRGTVLYCLCTLPLLGVLWGLQSYAQARPAVHVLFQTGRLNLVHGALGLLISWLVMVGGTAWFRRRKSAEDGELLAYLVVTPTLLMMAMLWVGYGLLDTPLGMMALEVLILARALFATRVVMPGLIIGLTVVLCAAGLEARGVMDISPLLAGPVFTGVELSWWWALWLQVVFHASAWPFVAVLLYLFHSLARHKAELETLAHTDTLTGLFNRREFMARLNIESHRHERSGQPMSVIMMDVDYFKRINDVCGHPGGDIVLARLGGLIRDGLRQNIDVAARMGGEEFAVLLPQTDLAGAERVARKLGDALRDTAFTFDTQSLRVTMSAGVVQVSGGQGELALREADANVYAAKQAGRDQIVSSTM